MRSDHQYVHFGFKGFKGSLGISAVADRLVTLLGTKLVFVNLQPLPETAVLELVARTLHIESSAAEPLAAALVKHSRGNAFAVRSLLMLLRNEDYVRHHSSLYSWRN